MKETEYYLFGASIEGINRYKELKERYNIGGFVDNDKNKWGKIITDGKKAVSIEEFLQKKKDNHIIITSRFSAEISAQLDRLNFENYSFYPCLEHFGDSRHTDKNLCKEIDSCAKIVFKKLHLIEIDKLNISDYNKRYLSGKTWLDMYKYSCIMYASLSANVNITNFIDYGGGTGLLSLLAIECGIKNVYYNDIYDVSVSDANEIASALGYKRKAYVEGDIEQVISFCGQTGILFDAVASYDVLEHIYDLECFFKKFKKILNPKYIVIMETGANPYNTDIFNSLTAGHFKIEYLHRDYVYGHKERDNLAAYFDLRLQIIDQYITSRNYDLSKPEQIGLSFLTRGMVKEDIENALDEYMSSGALPVSDFFGSFEHNTCDPFTGNWAEHIIDYEKLKIMLNKFGYEVKISFYDELRESSPTLQLILT